MMQQEMRPWWLLPGEEEQEQDPAAQLRPPVARSRFDLPNMDTGAGSVSPAPPLMRAPMGQGPIEVADSGDPPTVTPGLPGSLPGASMAVDAPPPPPDMMAKGIVGPPKAPPVMPGDASTPAAPPDMDPNAMGRDPRYRAGLVAAKEAHDDQAAPAAQSSRFGAGPLAQAHLTAAQKYAELAGKKTPLWQSILQSALTRDLRPLTQNGRLGTAERQVKALGGAAEEERKQQANASAEELKREQLALTQDQRRAAKVQPGTPAQQLALWMDAGYTREQAMQIVQSGGKLAPPTNIAPGHGVLGSDGKYSVPVEVTQKPVEDLNHWIARLNDPKASPMDQAVAMKNISMLGQSKEKDSKTQRDDQAISIYAKPKAAWTPEDAAFIKGYTQYVNQTKVQPGVLRVEAMGDTRMYPVIDKKTGNMVMASATDINRNPGGYAPAGQGATAMGKEAVFQDLHYNIDTARKAIQGLESMDAGTRAALSYALRHTDPGSAIQTFLTGQVGTNLNPQQQEAVQALALLSENALSLRGVAGMGQGSDDLRAAIQATLPSGKSPSKGYALNQLKKFEDVVNRLETGNPTVRTKQGGGATQGGGSGVVKWGRDAQGNPVRVQ